MFYEELTNCHICPRNCGVDRYAGEAGYCGTGTALKIASFGPHYGEEPEICGWLSSGTIFLSSCNLLCNFCQNYEISHFGYGREYSEEELAEIMLKLQVGGNSNINFVSPTHYSPQLIRSVIIAREMGLNIPIVYNTGGYDKIETLKLWDGIVDIYMPDLKFVSSEKSKIYTGAEAYFEIASAALLEMYRQKGSLKIINGTAKRGLLIRHLVLPNNQSDTKEVIDFIADRLGADTYLNLMDQYRPCYKAAGLKEINRGVKPEEFNEYVLYAKSKGFKRPGYLYDLNMP